MRMALVMLVAVLMLAGCGSFPLPRQAATAVPTVPPTVAYSGARTHGYPTPGQFKITDDSVNGIFLNVDGEVAAIIGLYVAAWRADGWQEANRDGSGNTTLISLTRGEDRQLLVFMPNKYSSTPVTSVYIPPQR